LGVMRPDALTITTGLDNNGDGQINDRPAGINRNSDLPASLYSLIPNRCIADCQPGGSPTLLRDHLAADFPNGVTAIGPGSVIFNISVSRTFSLSSPFFDKSSSAAGGRALELGIRFNF
jgi:hypothetical protein